MSENLVRRCCVCKRTVTEPTKDSKYSDGVLSEECYKTFYSKEDRKIIGNLNFNYKTCKELYPQIKD